MNLFFKKKVVLQNNKNKESVGLNMLSGTMKSGKTTDSFFIKKLQKGGFASRGNYNTSDLLSQKQNKKQNINLNLKQKDLANTWENVLLDSNNNNERKFKTKFKINQNLLSPQEKLSFFLFKNPSLVKSQSLNIDTKRPINTTIPVKKATQEQIAAQVMENNSLKQSSNLKSKLLGVKDKLPNIDLKFDNEFARASAIAAFNLLNKRKVDVKPFNAKSLVIRPAQGMTNDAYNAQVNQLQQGYRKATRPISSDAQLNVLNRVMVNNNLNDQLANLNARNSEMLRQDQLRFSSEMNQDLMNKQQIDNQNIQLRNQAKEAQQTERVNRLASVADVFNKYFEANRLRDETINLNLLRAKQLDKSNVVQNLANNYAQRLNQLYAKNASQTEIDALKNEYNNEINKLMQNNSYFDVYQSLYK